MPRSNRKNADAAADSITLSLTMNELTIVVAAIDIAVHVMGKRTPFAGSVLAMGMLGPQAVRALESKVLDALPQSAKDEAEAMSGDELAAITALLTDVAAAIDSEDRPCKAHSPQPNLSFGINSRLRDLN